jgi:hypothetical protein
LSYVSKKGKAAAESATAEKKDFAKALVSFKSGSAYKVRIATDEDYCEYAAVSVFKAINTTPVAPDSLYQKAVDLLYGDAKKAEATDAAKAEELRNQAYQLKPKPRYLFAFINLENGEPMIVDVSKAQAKVLIASIDKNAKKLAKKPFELSKAGQGTSTAVSLMPLDDDDLSAAELANFEKTLDVKIDDELYEKVLYVKDDAEQRQDLTVFGFDVSRLGGGAADEVTPIENTDIDSEDLPF